MSFGDGSNRWIDGFVETVQNPVDRATHPYDTLAGAADAAALNFDEGVGGLVSLVDDQPGNTAGAGDSSIWSTDADRLGGLQLVLFAALAMAVLWVVRPLLEIVSTIVEEVAED
jgi:hypothetical protein